MRIDFVIYIIIKSLDLLTIYSTVWPQWYLFCIEAFCLSLQIQFSLHAGNLMNNMMHCSCICTSDGVIVGVVIRSVEWYDLVKIKPTESEAEHWFRLWLCSLWSSENSFVKVTSRSGRINQWQCSIQDLVIGWFFHFCFQLWQTFHWIIKRQSRKGIGRNANVVILPNPIPSSLWLCLQLRFRFLSHKLSSLVKIFQGSSRILKDLHEDLYEDLN